MSFRFVIICAVFVGAFQFSSQSSAQESKFSLSCSYTEYDVVDGVRSRVEQKTMLFSFDLVKNLWAAKSPGNEFEDAHQIHAVSPDTITVYEKDSPYGEIMTIDRFSGKYSYRVSGGSGVRGYTMRVGDCTTRPYDPLPAPRF